MRKKIQFGQNSRTILTIAILMALVIIGYDTLFTPQEDRIILINSKNYEVKSPRSAEIHAPISINGNLELAEFCTVGSGTSEDPYIIENLEINAKTDNLIHGIEIRSTNLYLIIRNCRIENASNNGLSVRNGIYCSQVKHLTITNNEISNNKGHGIYLSGSNNTIKGNNCSYNGGSGIYLSGGGSNNTIKGNNFLYNGYGMLVYSDYCQISGNNFLYNYYGIKSSGDRGQISGNNCSYNYYGIYSKYSNSQISGNNCSYNNYGIYLGQSGGTRQISGNNCSYNNYGIYLDNVYDLKYSSNKPCQISGNNCSYNNYGIYLEDSEDNTLWKNIFIENSHSQVFCDAYSDSNDWYLDRIGNYWSDYEVLYPDASNDGYIWSEPHHINGTPSTFDSYPLVYQYKYPAPLEWNDLNNQIYGNTSSSFSYDVNATDNGAIDQYWLEDCWGYHFDNATLYFSIDGNGIITNSSVLSAGEYPLRIRVNDTRGNHITRVVYINIEDTTPPEWKNNVEEEERKIAGYIPIILIGDTILCIVVIFFSKYRNFKTLNQ